MTTAESWLTLALVLPANAYVLYRLVRWFDR
jgi:hypothetical protein